MSQNTITMTPEQLQEVIASAVTAALSASGVTAAPSTPAPEKSAPAKVKSTTWENAVGYTCKGEWTASTSSRAIRRHLAGSCGCKGEGSCKWVQNGRLTAESFGSRPDILGIERLADEQRVVFVGEGGKVIDDVTI